MVSPSLLEMPQQQASLPWHRRIHIDLPLLTALMLLSGLGIAILYSAADSEMALVKRQLIHMAIAFVCMLVIAQIPPVFMKKVAPWAYLLGIGLLVAVLVMGDIGKGAQRWLEIGGFRFQPSELVKLTVPLVCAWYLSGKKTPMQFWNLLVIVLVVLLPALLIAKQPDLGTAILVASGGFFVLFFSGLSWRLINVAVFIFVIGILIILYFPDTLDLFLFEYQKQRVLNLFNPEADPLGSGYHIIQSAIAIGSGGFFGKGWLNGTQSHLEFLPEPHTDFIFAVIAEEFGFAGAIVLFVLYLAIIFRGLFIAARAKTQFARLLAGALTLVFFVYLVVNTGMVSGIIPVVGIPLPLISYGGTSLITLAISFGILMAIQTHSDDSKGANEKLI